MIGGVVLVDEAVGASYRSLEGLEERVLERLLRFVVVDGLAGVERPVAADGCTESRPAGDGVRVGGGVGGAMNGRRVALGDGVGVVGRRHDSEVEYGQG